MINKLSLYTQTFLIKLFVQSLESSSYKNKVCCAGPIVKIVIGKVSATIFYIIDIKSTNEVSLHCP